MSTLFIPGRGVVDLEARRIDAAVSEYDERLFAARHPETNHPGVFIKMPPSYDGDNGLVISGQRAIPVLVFPGGFPHPDHVLGELHKRDAVRRGTEILDEINRRNDQLKAAGNHAASEAAGEVAEVMASARHQLGLTPYHQSLRKRSPKHRAYSKE